MSLSPAREADLLAIYSAVEHAWRVASDRSFAHSVAWRTFFGVAREQGGVDPIAPELAIGWLKTGNPHYVDAAVCRAQKLAIGRGETLDKLLIDVAELRTKAATTAGGPFRLRRAMAKDIAFTLMGLSQVCTDETLQSASSKAAQWLYEYDPEFSCTAGTLERKYPQSWQQKLASPGEFSEPMTKEEFTAELLFERFSSLPQPDGSPVIQEIWATAIDALPLAPPELTGARH